MSGAVGRPTDYTPEMVERIIGYLIEGDNGRPMGLKELCDKHDDVVHWTTVFRWQNEYPEFCYLTTRAREWQGDILAWEGEKDCRNICTVDDSKIVFVRNKHRQFMASKLARKSWGDRISQEISGPDGEPIRTAMISEEPLPDDEFDKRFGVAQKE